MFHGASCSRSRSIWLLWAQYFCLSYPWYFYITWLPTFLKERYPEMTDAHRATLAILPLFFGGLGALFCGFRIGSRGTLVGSVSLPEGSSHASASSARPR